MDSPVTIGAFEAKTRFSELLEQVRQGAEIVITKHERPVARLVPMDRRTKGDWGELFRQMDDFRSRPPSIRRALRS